MPETHVDDVDIVFLSYNLDDMQYLLDVLDTFCQISGLRMNVDETKMMAIQPRHPHFYMHELTDANGVKLQIGMLDV